MGREKRARSFLQGSRKFEEWSAITVESCQSIGQVNGLRTGRRGNHATGAAALEGCTS